MSRYLALVFVLAVSLIHCIESINSSPVKSELELLIEGYDAINDYLVDKASPDSIEQNVDQAIYWMNSKSMKLTKMFRGPLDIALHSFTALTDTTKTDIMCRKESYTILLKNDQATESRTHKPTSMLKPRTIRIDKIVHHYALKHAKQCQSFYPKVFDQVYKGMAVGKLTPVETYLNELISSRLFEHDPNLPVFHADEVFFFQPEQRALFVETVLYINTVTGPGDTQVAHHAITNSDRNARNLMAKRPDKVPSLVRTHLVEPCKYYVETLGPDVFDLADYDTEILEEDERFQPYTQQLRKFYLAWAHFRLCKIVIANQADLTKQVLNMSQKMANF